MKEFASDHKIALVDNRARSLLKTLINLYLEDGKPVGSRTLAKISALNLSAASIRNIMADLEELSLLQAPHPSAGRVPTEFGYRFFIDELLELRPLSATVLRRIQQALSEETLRQIAKQLAEVVAHYSQLVVLVALPSAPRQLKQIGFHRLSDGRMLMFLECEDGGIEHNFLPNCALSDDDFDKLAQILNAQLPKTSLEPLIQEISKEIQNINLSIDCLENLLQKAEIHRLRPRQAELTLVMAGQNHVIDFFSEQSEAGKANLQPLKALLQLLEARQDVLKLLDQYVSAPVWTLPWQVRLGHEHQMAPLKACSLIVTPYCHSQGTGLLALLGPMRMPYGRLISLLHTSAERLTLVLKAEDLPLY